jgi:cell division protein FtsW
MVVSVRRLFHAESGEYVVMVATVLFLVAFGLVMVLSSSFVGSALGNDGNFFATFLRQAFWAVVGIPLMLIVSRLKPIQIKRATPAMFLAALVFQALVFTALGITAGGNRNWVNIAGFSGQPSELLKVALIAWMAAILSDRLDRLHDYRVLLRPLAVGVAVALALVIAGRDLGTVGIMTMIALGVSFLAGVRLSHLVAVMGALGAFLGITALLSPSRVARIMTWFSGCTEADYLTTCWQSVHSTYALGSGGLLGVGLGNSRAKWSWLPAAETDFIFAIVGEELGLAGTTLVIVAFVVLAIAMTRMVRAQQDPFARIVTGGVMVWLIGQALVNIAVVLELLPVLGVPLPFMSVGGSALLSSLAAIGVVMALNRAGSESVGDYRARRRAGTR